MTLVLSRAQGPHPGDGGREDYDVLDVADRLVGRIYLIDSYNGGERWFWGVELKMSRPKTYGCAQSFDEAKAAFKTEYERWLEEQARPSFAEKATRYRNKAEEFRRLAEQERSEVAQKSYLMMADSYDKMLEDMKVLAEFRRARIERQRGDEQTAESAA